MRRHFFAAGKLALAALVLTLGACGGGGTEDTTDAGTATPPVTNVPDPSTGGQSGTAITADRLNSDGSLSLWPGVEPTAPPPVVQSTLQVKLRPDVVLVSELSTSVVSATDDMLVLTGNQDLNPETVVGFGERVRKVASRTFDGANTTLMLKEPKLSEAFEQFIFEMKPARASKMSIAAANTPSQCGAGDFLLAASKLASVKCSWSETFDWVTLYDNSLKLGSDDKASSVEIAQKLEFRFLPDILLAYDNITGRSASSGHVDVLLRSNSSVNAAAELKGTEELFKDKLLFPKLRYSLVTVAFYGRGSLSVAATLKGTMAARAGLSARANFPTGGAGTFGVVDQYATVVTKMKEGFEPTTAVEGKYAIRVSVDADFEGASVPLARVSVGPELGLKATVSPNKPEPNNDKWEKYCFQSGAFAELNAKFSSPMLEKIGLPLEATLAPFKTDYLGQPSKWGYCPDDSYMLNVVAPVKPPVVGKPMQVEVRVTQRAATDPQRTADNPNPPVAPKKKLTVKLAVPGGASCEALVGDDDLARCELTPTVPGVGVVKASLLPPGYDEWVEDEQAVDVLGDIALETGFAMFNVCADGTTNYDTCGPDRQWLLVVEVSDTQTLRKPAGTLALYGPAGLTALVGLQPAPPAWFPVPGTPGGNSLLEYPRATTAYAIFTVPRWLLGPTNPFSLKYVANGGPIPEQMLMDDPLDTPCNYHASCMR